MYVKPYVKSGKSEAIDAEAICEEVTRPTMCSFFAEKPMISGQGFRFIAPAICGLPAYTVG